MSNLHPGVSNWSNYAPYFKKEEFDCKHTKKNEMKIIFMDSLFILRKECNFSFVINSGFRDITHPQEIKKTTPGYHTKGLACDISVWSDKAFSIIETSLKLELPFNQFGISQKEGIPRFLHLGIIEGSSVIYSY